VVHIGLIRESDTYLRVIPVDPACVPSALARERASTILSRAVPLADDVASQVTEDVRFVDCGANFETVSCPRCGTDLGEWWSTAMELAHEQQFRDLRITTPCCARRTSLNELVYSWPAGFARYSLEVLNPGVGSLSEQTVRRLEGALGVAVRVIWAHY
jgi:hypothetical protein